MPVASIPVSEVSDRFNTPDTALNRLLLEAPYLSRCSDNKTASLVRPRNHAVRFPYMQVNRVDMKSWLVFDLDHSNPFIWEDEGLPTPNIIVSNPASGSSHLYYAINPVCTSDNARENPIKFMKAIYKAMVKRLDADPGYSGPVGKTPGHPWWRTTELHADEYSLGELWEYVEIESDEYQYKEKDLEAVSHSRHLTLFEHLRFFAYSQVDKHREEGSFKSFYSVVESFAEKNNSFRSAGFSQNLTFSQTKAIVKSVSRWTWDKYNASFRHKRVLNLDSSLPLNERQRLGAEHTHAKRKTDSEEKILSACKCLRAESERITQVRIAQMTGLSRQTVAKYKHLFNESEAAINDVINVNFGRYKITAELDERVIDKEKLLLTTEVKQIKAEVINLNRDKTVNALKDDDDNLVNSTQRVGAKPKKSLFSRLCTTFSAIPTDHGKLNSKFTFEERGRLAKVLLSQKLPEHETVLVALSVIQRTFEPEMSCLSIRDWAGYIITSCRNKKRDIFEQIIPVIDKFSAFQAGKEVKLSNREMCLFRSYKELIDR